MCPRRTAAVLPRRHRRLRAFFFGFDRLGVRVRRCFRVAVDRARTMSYPSIGRRGHTRRGVRKHSSIPPPSRSSSTSEELLTKRDAGRHLFDRFLTRKKKSRALAWSWTGRLDLVGTSPTPAFGPPLSRCPLPPAPPRRVRSFLPSFPVSPTSVSVSGARDVAPASDGPAAPGSGASTARTGDATMIRQSAGDGQTARHLTGECVFAREVWFRVLAPIGLANLAPSPGVAFLDWSLLHRMQLVTAKCKGFDSLIILGAWCLWKERNQRVFHGAGRSPIDVATMIEEEVDRWSQAGYGHLAMLWASRDFG
ncbi:unnamed protein product [Miscanthus lutarioriparius]|uniref:Uncharacterized protein n=1 Tax=Miscanthus lutarioriparius TaxID=422564 RepID=A0A811PL07_9POAL|nr:unnamed protein product [Miscanthus lutarioriparius]